MSCESLIDGLYVAIPAFAAVDFGACGGRFEVCPYGRARASPGGPRRPPGGPSEGLWKASGGRFGPIWGAQTVEFGK